MKFTAKTLFALVGAVLAIVMMLFPFASMSAFGYTESAGGFKVLFSSGEGMFTPLFVWISFLAGLAGIAVLFLGKGSRIAGICFAVAAAALLLFCVTFKSMDMGFGISLSMHAGAGAWLAMIFDLAAAVFALLGDLFPFLAKARVDGVTEKLDSAAASFQKTTDSLADRVKTAAARSSASTARICPACGAKAEADSNFCLACGTKLPEPEPETPACPNCGAAVADDSKFCPACGTKLGE